MGVCVCIYFIRRFVRARPPTGCVRGRDFRPGLLPPERKCEIIIETETAWRVLGNQWPWDILCTQSHDTDPLTTHKRLQEHALTRTHIYTSCTMIYVLRVCVYVYYNDKRRRWVVVVTDVLLSSLPIVPYRSPFSAHSLLPRARPRRRHTGNNISVSCGNVTYR